MVKYIFHIACSTAILLQIAGAAEFIELNAGRRNVAPSFYYSAAQFTGMIRLPKYVSIIESDSPLLNQMVVLTIDDINQCYYKTPSMLRHFDKNKKIKNFTFTNCNDGQLPGDEVFIEEGISFHLSDQTRYKGQIKTSIKIEITQRD